MIKIYFSGTYVSYTEQIPKTFARNVKCILLLRNIYILVCSFQYLCMYQSVHGYKLHVKCTRTLFQKEAKTFKNFVVDMPLVCGRYAPSLW